MRHLGPGFTHAGPNPEPRPRFREHHAVRSRGSRRRHGSSAEQDAILELHRLAGNAAVTSALARARGAGRIAAADAIKLEQHPAAPEAGLGGIRKEAGGRGVMGYTIRAIEDSPPLMRPEAPTRTGAG